jgi:hypothetical protein
MTNRTQKILNSETSKKSVNTDVFMKVSIDSNERLLPTNEINKIVNVGDQFNYERQNSGYYRIIGSINPNISNVLFNLNDTTNEDLYTWAGFNYLDQSTNKYRFGDGLFQKAIEENLKERDGWFGYYNLGVINTALNKKVDMEPKAERFLFSPTDSTYHNQSTKPIKNWELTITYPYGSDSNHPMINGGILIVEAIPAVVSTRSMVAFGMPCQHNLLIGDVVRITGTSGYDGDHIVVRTGKDDGELKNYYFVIDLPPTGLVSGNSRIKKMVGGVESEYYFRLFKKIKTRANDVIEANDYECYKLAFSENSYSDIIQQFVFNDDIDIKDLKDNLGRPLSEFFLTILKTPSGTQPNELFTSVSAGIETPFISELNNSGILTYLLDIPAINKLHNGGPNSPFISHSALTQNVLISDNAFYGDLVEYNKIQVKETVLADVSHRFNTINRETELATITYNLSLENTALNLPATTYTTNLGPRKEGYFYKAHYRIPLKEYSDYVEQGDIFTVGIPDYAVDLGDGRYIWRDLLDIGVYKSDDRTLDYPFLNGCHYIYNNICFSLRRQDPFNNWGLYYNTFPADPVGDRTTDKFNFNSSTDVC